MSESDPRSSVIVFLRAYDTVAACLRSMKLYALDAISRGDIYVDVSAERMWPAAHENAFQEALGVEVPSMARQVAADLLRRLRLWKEMARQARETEAHGVELHVQEVWESSDERALAQFESIRARLTGEQELPFMDEAV